MAGYDREAEEIRPIEGECLSDLIESLTRGPCFVVDVLPRQVPSCGGGRFFDIERQWFEGSGRETLRARFCDVLLRLYCFRDLVVVWGEDETGETNPSPEGLAKRVLSGEEPLSVIVEADGALLSVPSDGTCMALFDPTPELLELVERLASAAGLFVWSPDHAGGPDLSRQTTS